MSKPSWITRSLLLMVSLILVASASTKIVQVPKVVEHLTHAGVPGEAVVPIGILELSCLILFLIPRTAGLGTLLLTGYLGGAVMTHIIGRENFAPPLVVGMLVWAAAYARLEELRDLLPFRKMPEHRVLAGARPATS